MSTGSESASPPPSVKETCRLIRKARTFWDAHENKACRRERDRALAYYEKLTPPERAEIPEQLKVWLRYRSEKYFGETRTAPGTRNPRSPKMKTIVEEEKKKAKPPGYAVSSRKIASSVGPLVILASKKGLAGLHFAHRIEKSTLPAENPRDKILNRAEKELAEYFAGERSEFEVPLDARGSKFQREVWRELSRIPFGETRTYGEIAEVLGNPGAVRAVGTANGANPISIIVPCHRVIGKDGSLTGFGGGLPIKEKLLRHERKRAELDVNS